MVKHLGYMLDHILSNLHLKWKKQGTKINKLQNIIFKNKANRLFNLRFLLSNQLFAKVYLLRNMAFEQISSKGKQFFLSRNRNIKGYFLKQKTIGFHLTNLNRISNSPLMALWGAISKVMQVKPPFFCDQQEFQFSHVNVSYSPAHIIKNFTIFD